jgi:hypothetical protein
MNWLWANERRGRFTVPIADLSASATNSYTQKRGADP